jgi:upstream activation factor subunit UAF30
MADFLGMEECPRGQVVKKLWEYIKANKLQDPKDGRRIVFDDKFKVLFGDNGRRKSMNMLQMNKLLSRHVKIDDRVEGDVDNKKGGRSTKVAKIKELGTGKPKIQATSTNRAETKRKDFILSPEMQAFVGAETMSRPDIVKKMWEHVKEHDLQDPADLRYILSDDALENLTGEARFQGFSFMKLVKDHIS